MSDIRKVAELARVSTATVSRALSRPEIVKEETRNRVLKAVRRLGYTPNVMGRSLRARHADTVVVLVPDISNIFFAEIIHGMEHVAHQRGYSVLLGDTQSDPEREDMYANHLNTKQADGLLFLGHRIPATVARYVRKRSLPSKPIVNVCEYSPELRVPGVHVDNATAAFEAITYLMGLGHKRFGIVTGPMEGPLSRERLRGVREALDKGRIRLAENSIVHGDYSIESGIRAAEGLLRLAKPPSAIFCFNDEMAMGVLEFCRSAGVGVPEQLSVVGFDDIRFAAHTSPALTTVYQPTQEIGVAAMNLLLELIEGEKVDETELILPTQLIIRESTGPAP